MQPEPSDHEHPATLGTLPPETAIPAQDRRPLTVVPDLDEDDESHLIRGYD